MKPKHSALLSIDGLRQLAHECHANDAATKIAQNPDLLSGPNLLKWWNITIRKKGNFNE